MSETLRLRRITKKNGQIIIEETGGESHNIIVKHETMENGRPVTKIQDGNSMTVVPREGTVVDPLGLRPDRRTG